MAEVNWVPILVPLVLVQVVLAVVALLDLRKQEKARYVGKPIWVVIIIMLQVFGPLVYFMLGRED